MKLIHVFSIFATPENFFGRQFKFLLDQGHKLTAVSNNAQNTDSFCLRIHLLTLIKVAFADSILWFVDLLGNSKRCRLVNICVYVCRMNKLRRITAKYKIFHKPQIELNKTIL